MPNTTEPAKAAAASTASSTGSIPISPAIRQRNNAQRRYAPGVHRAQPLNVARKGQAVLSLEQCRARPQFAPRDFAWRALQADDDDVRVAQRLEREHGAAEGVLEALQVAVE